MSQEPIKKSEAAEREEQILKFWQENKIFEKTLEKESPKGKFVFYEGPPTANAKPALHHLEARVFKDIIPRYKTMQGYEVPRRAGWDTHGLPVELQIEKKLGLTSKKEIENFGVKEFNKACKDSVFEYIGDWEKFTDRIGYWVDKKNAYYTFNPKYMESVWNIVKTANNKGLLYKDYKVLPWCPRCGTALSSHELAQGYTDVKDLSVTVEFNLKNKPNTSILAWTTTPWTLPGNVALAVGENIEYVEVELSNKRIGDLSSENGNYVVNEPKYKNIILSKNTYEKFLSNGTIDVTQSVRIVSNLKGKDLLGLEYEPIYPYLKDNLPNSEKEKLDRAFKIYAADFVTTEDGTGVVHTAVMYGQDDFVLGNKIGLPKYHLVNEDGTFKQEVEKFAGRFVKDDEVAIDIIKDLAHRNLLFKKEKYEHSYPHCWRCKTPLIYFARDSWYIKMSELRDELVDENKEINWVPSHIREGRFGEWLKDIKDWAISRERYWGTPLPIWTKENGEFEVVGSIGEIKKRVKKSGNKYFTIRHGEAEQNIKDLINSELSNNIYHLTEGGRKRVLEASENIKKEKIDFIITSPFLRCKETAEIVREALGLDASCVQEDERLAEFKKGPGFEGKSWQEYWGLFSSTKERFEKSPDGGENLTDLNKRAGEFIYDLEKRYSGKNILIVSHQGPIASMHMIGEGADADRFIEAKEKQIYTFGFADFRKLDFVPLPHNENYEIDLHKPYIDDVILIDDNGKEMRRVKEVMDVWFDSGSMPFSQEHYPFSKEKIDYPADFISEAIDQTRGWFYTLHAIGVIMGKGKAYKNVICLGHILDSEGKKMSKSIGNIVDPNLMIEKYGVDTLRFWMYSVNQPGDSKNFDEKTVDEIVKKVWNPLLNILSFYEMYNDENIEYVESKNVLDIWVISRLGEVIGEGTKYLEKYDAFSAARLVKDFVNDFSAWYIRRSRDRFKSEDVIERRESLSTTKFVLRELSKYLAPFAPFFAEFLYQKLKENGDKESIHLSDWPKEKIIEKNVLKYMEEVRNIVSLALEKRNVASIKVRQPLQKVILKNAGLRDKEEYLNLIKDEVNVKEVLFNENIEEEIELDTLITEGLKKEGMERDVIRLIQELRKTSNLNPLDSKKLSVDTDENGKRFLEDAAERIKTPTNINSFIFEANDGQENIIENMKFKFKIS